MKTYTVCICGVKKGTVMANNDSYARRKARKRFPDFENHISVYLELDPYHNSQRSPFGL